MRKTVAMLATALAVLSATAQADLRSSSPTHFELHHEALSALAPEQMWERLLHPALWWSPEHTYSGEAANLTLEAKLGGYWREDWDGGAVAHGRVLFIHQGKTLRLEAPFGPLQGMGAYTIWTITIEAHEKGSRIEFQEVASGPPSAPMETLAVAVDAVKAEAITRLAGTR